MNAFAHYASRIYLKGQNVKREIGAVQEFLQENLKEIAKMGVDNGWRKVYNATRKGKGVFRGNPERRLFFYRKIYFWENKYEKEKGKGVFHAPRMEGVFFF